MAAVIVDARIELVEGEYLTASRVLKVGEIFHNFWRERIISYPNKQFKLFLTHFLSSLLTTISVTNFDQLVGKYVQVEILYDHVVGITNKISDLFFILSPA